MEEEPGSQSTLRPSNRLRVIQALQVLGVTSRADVARHTGLSPLDRLDDRRRASGRGHGRRPRRRRTRLRRRRAPARADRPRPGRRPRDRHRLRQAPPRASRSPTSRTSCSPRSGARCRTTTTPTPGSSGRPSSSSCCSRRPARTAGACSASGWAFPARSTGAASSARPRSCPAGPATHAAELMSERLGTEVCLRQRRQPRRAGGVDLGRRTRRGRPRLPEARRPASAPAS